MKILSKVEMKKIMGGQVSDEEGSPCEGKNKGDECTATSGPCSGSSGKCTSKGACAVSC